MTTSKQGHNVKAAVSSLREATATLSNQTASWKEDLQNNQVTTLPVVKQWDAELIDWIPELRSAAEKMVKELEAYRHSEWTGQSRSDEVRIRNGIKRQIAVLHREIKLEKRRIYWNSLRRQIGDRTRPFVNGVQSLWQYISDLVSNDQGTIR